MVPAELTCKIQLYYGAVLEGPMRYFKNPFGKVCFVLIFVVVVVVAVVVEIRESRGMWLKMYTSVNLKIFLYVYVNIKGIPWKFRILILKNSRVIYT